MKEKTKSILESLIELSDPCDNSMIIESRGTRIIENAISLIETIADCYGDEFASDIEKRLISSIRNKNHGKFVRGVKSKRNV